MPRQGNGNYILPAGNPVAPQTLIRSSWANTTMNDLGQALTQSISSDGQTAPSADLPMAGFRHTSVGLAISGTQYARADQDQQNALKMLTSAAMPTANAYTANLALATATFTVGQVVYFIPPAANTGPATLNVNATGPVAIVNSAGAALSDSMLIQGVLVQLWWNGSAWAILAPRAVGSLVVPGSTGTIAAVTGVGGVPLQVVNAGTAGDAAYMGFNRVSIFGGVLGIDTDNNWKVGGWSMGAVSYKLLHEGNSFTIGASSLEAKGRDLYTHRNNTTGLVGLGDQSGGVRVLYYDGASYTLTNAPVYISGKLGLGSNAASPLAALDVGVGTTQHIVFSYDSAANAPQIVGCTDGFAAHSVISFGTGVAVQPTYDNLTLFGAGARRWAAVFAVNGVIQTSDAREKRNIEPSALGLDFIESLNPVSYQRIVGKNEVTRVPDYEEEVPERMDIDGNIIPATTRTIYKDVVTPLPGVRTHYGLIAQDVQRAVVASGVADFGGYIPAEADTPDGLQGLCYTEFIAPLVKAVQELSAKVKALEAQLGGVVVPK